MTSKNERDAAIRLKEKDKRRFRSSRLWFAIAAIGLGITSIALGLAGYAMECLIFGVAGGCCVLQSWDAHETIQDVKRRPDRLLWSTRGNEGGPGSRALKTPDRPLPEPSKQR